MKKIKWGILGPGIIAHEFVQDFKHVSNGMVHAVASRSSNRSETFAKTYDIPMAYDCYEELYNDPEIDAIYIATPHNFHYEQSIAAMKSGKSVLCEKPLTEQPETSQKLISFAREHDVYLMEGMWTYFLPAIQKAKEWADQSKIGKVLHLKSSFGYPVPYDEQGRYYNPDLSGGCMLDMGIYNVAMAELFIGHEMTNLHTKIHHAPTGVENDVLSQIDYGDVTATLHSAFRCKLHNHCYIIGENGYIDIQDFWRARGCKLYEGEKVIEEYLDERKGNGFEYQIQAVSQNLLEGVKQPEVVTHETTMKFQKAMQRIMNG